MKINLREKKNWLPRFAELLFTFEGQEIVLYDYQKKFLLDASPFRIIMKARQLGLSWVIALEGLLTALLKPYQTILFVSSGEEAAKRVLVYVYAFINGMSIKPKLLNSSMTECRFANQSRIVSLPNNSRCYSGDTEILTKYGWKRFDKLLDDDIVGQVDSKTLELTYVKPTEVVREHFVGKMYHLKNRCFDLLITPNHRLLLTQYAEIGDRLYNRRVENISELTHSDNRMFKAVKFTGKEIDKVEIPRGQRVRHCRCKGVVKTKNFSQKIVFSGDDFCRFMGIYLAEGCSFFKKGSFYQANIAQFPGWKKDKIEKFLKTTNIKFSIYKTGFSFYNKDLCLYLKQFGYAYEKYVPDIIKNATPKQMKLFLEWYWLGDGSLQNGRHSSSSTSKRLTDDVQEMLIKCGCGANAHNVPPETWTEENGKTFTSRPAYGIREQITNLGEYRYYGWFNREKHVKTIDYNNKIFCVSVPTGMIMVRRNGKPVVCGNTTRGYRANKIYLDEFASLMNDSEIIAAIQPSISRGGTMTILSTPRGRANRFWDIWDDDASGYSRHRIDWTQCPDKSYRKMVKHMMATMLDLDFRQEYMTDPSISDMAFFTRELLKEIINLEAYYLSSLETKNKVVMGIDFGKRVSSTAITIAEQCEDVVRIRLQEELRNMPYDFAVGEKSTQLKRIAEVNDVFNVDEIKIDATGVGVRLEEDMRRLFGAKVESVIFSLKTKEILITNFKILCEKRGIELVNDAEFITQLLSLERDLTPAGNLRYKHIKGKKDDRVWSAALAVKDMLRPINEGGCVFGGDSIASDVNRHLDTLRPMRHILIG